MQMNMCLPNDNIILNQPLAHVDGSRVLPVHAREKEEEGEDQKPPADPSKVTEV
jgi:hypothetical protein